MAYTPIQYPTLNDAPPPEWPINDFSGGKNDKVEANLINDNQCTDCSNVISVTIGETRSRPGQAKLNSTELGGAIQGLHPFYYGANRKLICVANGSAYFWNATAWSTAIKSGMSATSQFDFETCINYMVAMDGVGAPWKYDGTTVSALANAPATGKCPTWFKEKLFCISDADTVKFSDAQLPETWTAINNKVFSQGDGDTLQLLVPYGSGRELLVCKKRKIHHLVGTDMDDFEQYCIEPNHGVVGLRAGIVLEPFFYYISDDGIFKWNGVQSVNLIDPENVPVGIPNTWATANKAYLSTSVTGYNPVYNHLEFTIPTGSSTTPNTTLVYDLNHDSWWPFTNINPSCMVQYNDGTNIKTYVGHATSGFVIERNTGYSDYGTAITGYWTGKNFDNGTPAKEKKIKEGYVFDVNGGNDMTYSYDTNDSGSFTSPTVKRDKNNVRRFRISKRCRRFQPKLSFTSSTATYTCSGLTHTFDPGRNR